MTKFSAASFQYLYVLTLSMAFMLHFGCDLPSLQSHRPNLSSALFICGLLLLIMAPQPQKLNVLHMAYKMTECLVLQFLALKFLWDLLLGQLLRCLYCNENVSYALRLILASSLCFVAFKIERKKKNVAVGLRQAQQPELDVPQNFQTDYRIGTYGLCSTEDLSYWKREYDANVRRQFAIDHDKWHLKIK
ncbi:uncharacterized protein LOC108604567 [Drosophila busckii]|uniref:uncharacterized protein LOC108604567 n=1 Tax=Drosophila busckii TaxID=30019 RepID=UPI001432B1AD|nr:uncharacterized protein LOC108604567 [Drosophila busckii]